MRPLYFVAPRAAKYATVYPTTRQMIVAANT